MNIEELYYLDSDKCSDYFILKPKPSTSKVGYTTLCKKFSQLIDFTNKLYDFCNIDINLQDFDRKKQILFTKKVIIIESDHFPTFIVPKENENVITFIKKFAPSTIYQQVKGIQNFYNIILISNSKIKTIIENKANKR